MILSVTFSKPSTNTQDALGRNYIKIRIWKSVSVSQKNNLYQCEMFTEKQAFQKSMTEKEVEELIEIHAGKLFKSVVEKTDSEEITYLANRRGEIKILRKKNKKSVVESSKKINREKNYIIKENTQVPFLIELGVMTKDGKIVSRMYDKFRQINRFLEFVEDVIEDVIRLKGNVDADNPMRVIDFGSGKSYLTFAVWYFLHEIKKIPVEITGLDLKEDVIRNCQKLSEKLGCSGLNFKIGNIADYSEEKNPDMIITLHACDTATDYALEYAVRKNAFAILSVPCCQKEINLQLSKKKLSPENPYSIFTDYGIVQERFSALVTDLVRAKLLEKNGYNVQLMEFIDMEGTPKNLLVRAIKNRHGKTTKDGSEEILRSLGVSQTLAKIL